MDAPRSVAIIPAGAKSKRIPGTNVKLFCGEPLIACPIRAAKGDATSAISVGAHWLLPKWRAQDIDPSADWEYAEILYEVRAKRGKSGEVGGSAPGSET